MNVCSQRCNGWLPSGTHARGYYAIQAMMDDRFNLRGVMCSTGIHTPLVIVSGPRAKDLDINGGYNCFGFQVGELMRPLAGR
ncbi:MAG: hypothetical protein CM1200mP27_11950 [Chloroflexota bacterium]|nr:MAG: hypothetical protein CM1200mP27_11950 [Chloroflexota bacterium]